MLDFASWCSTSDTSANIAPAISPLSITDFDANMKQTSELQWCHAIRKKTIYRLDSTVVSHIVDICEYLYVTFCQVRIALDVRSNFIVKRLLLRNVRQGRDKHHGGTQCDGTEYKYMHMQIRS